MQKYNFYEFSGYQLIERLQENENNYIDFSTRVRKTLAGVIKSVEAHSENALFYQTKKCLQELAGLEEGSAFKDIIADWNNDSLKNLLIYIDFSGVFPYEKYAKRKFRWPKDIPFAQKEKDISECAKITEAFFMNGFDILFDTSEDPVHFVPFEKSASMARSASMIFIDSRLYKSLERRLRLGFNFSGDAVSASKLYAYTGLYLSDAHRIKESPNFMLNEETVIVLSDNVTKDKKVSVEVVSGEEIKRTLPGNSQEWSVRKYDAEEFTTSINYFDGEGLISPEYCAEINKTLNTEYGMFGTAASIQIRMPFTKGMLHNVDFHKFICEKLHLESCKDIMIKDAYGRSRSLEKAQIILTQSMFKIDKWLRNPKLSSIGEGDDPIGLYFKRFHEYDHAFHVGITDMHLSNAGRTKLNYQFLNTLALTDEELKGIADEHAGFAKSGKSRDLLYNIISDKINDEIDTSFDDAVEEYETWCVVAARNPAFLKDPKVKGMMKGVRYSLLKDLGRGRLTVNGSVKFLSRDLLALLSFMIGKIDCGKTVTEEQKKKAKNEIRKEQLWTTRFFVADSVPGNPVFTNDNRRLHLLSKSYYGILRNPHLSRNEQCSLSPFIPHKDGIYSRYFGHLKGILMVPQSSFVPQALGGADFDGDMVKLITDKRVNRAINDACYLPDSEESSKTHVRKLPIVMIPDTNPRVVTLPEDRVDFQTLQDTFSSRVGELSNRAIYLGKRQYDEKHPNPAYDLSCETGTILVGLEIDAAKSGRHPNLDEYLPSDRDSDYFIFSKQCIDELPKQHLIEVKEYPETSNTKGNIICHRLSVVAKYGANKNEELMAGVFTEQYSGFYRIDSLPLRFIRELSTLITAEEIDDKENSVRFDFEKGADWKKQVSDPEITERLEDLIRSYKRILKTSQSVYYIEERLKRSNYTGCINTILKLQQMGLKDEVQRRNLHEEAFMQLLTIFDSFNAAKPALKRLKDNRKWQFFETEDEKKSYADRYLFNDKGTVLSEEVWNMLNTFRWNGYFLLYYYIKDIMLYYYETETENRLEQGEDLSNTSSKPSRYYEEFREIYKKALENKESKKIWNKRIIERCRYYLKELFPDRIDSAIMYTHKLRKCDPYGTFFWDMFNANEILKKAGGSNAC